MLDGEAFGAEMVQIVREFVAGELDPLRAENKALLEANEVLAARVAALEAREIPVPEKGEPGADGADGRDGADCDMGLVKDLVAEQVAAAVAALPPAEKGEPGRDGADADMVAIEAAIDERIAAAVAALPPAKDGRDGVDGKDGQDGAEGLPGRDGADGKDGADGRDIERILIEQNGRDVALSIVVGETEFIAEFELPEGPAGPEGKQGPAGTTGKLELAREWTDDVSYEGSVRTHNGGTWQALRDTAKEPPHADWICLAAPGIAGVDGKPLNPRRLWAADEEYARLDVVALNGGSFVALRDDPGPCPGDGWMLMTSPGKRGERGERGERGARGEPGAPIVTATIDAQGLQTFVNGDGSTVECDLYPVLASLDGKR